MCQYSPPPSSSGITLSSPVVQPSPCLGFRVQGLGFRVQGLGGWDTMGGGSITRNGGACKGPYKCYLGGFWGLGL